MGCAHTVPDELERYECHDGRSNKFWMIQQQEIDGELCGNVATWYGRCGTEPRGGVYKPKGAASKATKFTQAQIRKKLKEGYQISGRGYNKDAYTEDGMPKAGEGPGRKTRIETEFLPFSRLQADFGEGLKDLKAVSDPLKISEANLDDMSGEVKAQFEFLRRHKFFLPRDSHGPHCATPAECFQTVDYGVCLVMDIVGGRGLQLSYWSAFRDNEFGWLVLKTRTGYVMLANGEDHFQEWGGSGTAEEDEYEPGEDEESACDAFLSAVHRLRYPDDDFSDDN